MAKAPRRQNHELAAGILALLHGLGWKKLPKTEAEIFAQTGADPKEAYELRDRLREQLPRLLSASPMDDPHMVVLVAVRDYFGHHADATRIHAGGLLYSGGFQQFLLRLAEPGGPAEGMSVAKLAYLSGVPEAMLQEWFRGQEAR